jgi:hypothetical protein
VNSVLEMNRSTIALGVKATPLAAPRTVRSTGSRRAMPTWLRRAVGTNDDRGMAALVGIRLGS